MRKTFLAAIALTSLMLTGATPSALASVPQLPTSSPDGLPGHVLPDIRTVYDSLMRTGRTLTEVVRAHRQKCDRVLDTNTAVLKECQISAADIELRWSRYDYEVANYSEKLAALRVKFPLARYVPAGHGLVLGLTAIGGFNVSPSLDAGTAARVRTEAEAQFTNAQSRAGVSPAERLHTDGYNFILGLASSPVISLTDVRELIRAMGDSLTDAETSRLHREVYPSLTGRYFETLECHSNGAMVCLTALKKGDVAARNVRLLGPQITPQSLIEWESLVERGYTNRVTVYWMGGDPIPFASMGFGGATQNASALAVADLRNRVSEAAPALEFQYFRCPLNSLNLPMLQCHNLRFYQEALGK